MEPYLARQDRTNLKQKKSSWIYCSQMNASFLKAKQSPIAQLHRKSNETIRKGIVPALSYNRSTARLREKSPLTLNS